MPCSPSPERESFYEAWGKEPLTTWREEKNPEAPFSSGLWFFPRTSHWIDMGKTDLLGLAFETEVVRERESGFYWREHRFRETKASHLGILQLFTHNSFKHFLAAACHKARLYGVTKDIAAIWPPTVDTGDGWVSPRSRSYRWQVVLPWGLHELYELDYTIGWASIALSIQRGNGRDK